MSAPGSPIGVVVVASWYPSALDPIHGRFIADQIRGVTESGRVSARVVSFEMVRLGGEPSERASQLAAVRAGTAATWRDPALFRPRAWSSPPSVPVARLPIPFGWVSDESEPSRAAADRTHALLGASGAIAEGLPRPALVHAHTAFPDGAAAAALASRLGVPLVITEHASFVERQLEDPSQRDAYLAAVAAAERFVAVSETLAAELRRDIPEVGGKLVVIPNAVATDDFTLVDPAARDPDELLFVGIRRESKGIELLLDAFVQVRARRPRTRLRLVGRAPSGAEEQRWVDHAAALGVADAVAFDPPADRTGVVEAVGRAGLFVHPSPRETFGVVAAEALASGLPVVATDSGGISEILGPDPARLGALVRSREPGALADAIIDALEHRERFDPTVLRASVEGRFGVRPVSRRLLELYEEVVAADRSPAPTPGASWAPGPARDPVVVVGRERKLARWLLAPVPPAVLARATLVTDAAPRPPLPEGLAAVVEIDPEADFRRALGAAGGGGRRGGPLGRVARLIRDPLGPLRRRRIRARRDEIVRAAPAAAIRRAIDEAGAGAGDPPYLLPLAGGDYETVQPMLASPGIRLAPGGLRWLADEDVPDGG